MAPRVTILSEGGTGVPAIFTPVKGGKLRRRVNVPDKMVSDLSECHIFSATADILIVLAHDS